MQGAPATCTFVGECEVEANAKVCRDAEQTCIDTDVAADNTWVCSCVAPQTGYNGLMMPGKCGTNECTAECPSCAGDTCAKAGQDCYDPDVTALNDWECRCKGAQVGEAGTAAAAVCTGVVCSSLLAETCAQEPECVYETYFGLCTDVVHVYNATAENATLGAPDREGDSDDDCDDFFACWWWLLLLLLLSCCLAAAFLLCRRRQQENDADDEKWNKQFEAEVKDEQEQDYAMEERSPHKYGNGNDSRTESLLYNEGGSQEMSPKSQPASRPGSVADDDI